MKLRQVFFERLNSYQAESKIQTLLGCLQQVGYCPKKVQLQRERERERVNINNKNKSNISINSPQTYEAETMSPSLLELCQQDCFRKSQ